MSNKRKAVWFLVIAIIHSSYGYAISQETDCERDAAIGMYCMKTESISEETLAETGTAGVIKVPGNYLKSAMVAYDAFHEKLKNEVGNNSSPLATHLSDISNYSIIISKADDNGDYTVRFYPKFFQGSPVKGGGAIYIIDGKAFIILKKEYLM